MRLLPIASAAVCLGLSSPAGAAPPKWPFEFDPSLPANKPATQQMISEGEGVLPPLPVTTLTEVQLGSMKLWFFPEMAAQLDRASTAGPGAMIWPRTPSMCKGHAAFVIPPISPGAPANCASVRDEVVEELVERSACDDVEQPERYVLGYEPGKVDLNVTASLEGLIGLAGEALSHHPVPENLLPQDFPDALRRVIVKLRSQTLTAQLATSKAAYGRALTQVTQNATCFAGSTLSADLGALSAELDAASAHIAKVESEGKGDSAHEALCLAAKARARPSLPFPSLTRAERELIAFYLGGTYWRMRGGGVMPLGSTQAARFYFLQQPFTRIGELTGASDGADAALQIYLAVFDGWGDWMDMGSTPGGEDKYYDLVAMTRRGHQQVKTAVDLLAQRSYETSPLLTGGLQMGPCYYYAFEKLQSFRYGAGPQLPPYGEFIEGFTADGEFCAGATIALGLARTLLDGTPTGAAPTVDLCANRACGEDGCGGSCGSCGAGETCSEGACVALDASAPPPAPTDLAAAPSGPAAPPPARADVPVIASHGDGCGCSTTDPRGPAVDGRWLALAAALALALRRRPR